MKTSFTQPGRTGREGRMRRSYSTVSRTGIRGNAEGKVAASNTSSPSARCGQGDRSKVSWTRSNTRLRGDRGNIPSCVAQTARTAWASSLGLRGQQLPAGPHPATKMIHNGRTALDAHLQGHQRGQIVETPTAPSSASGRPPAARAPSNAVRACCSGDHLRRTHRALVSVDEP